MVCGSAAIIVGHGAAICAALQRHEIAALRRCSPGGLDQRIFGRRFGHAECAISLDREFEFEALTLGR